MFQIRHNLLIYMHKNNEGVGQDLATIAKDEKLWLSTTVYAKNRYQDHIWPENHPLNEQRQRGGAVPSN